MDITDYIAGNYEEQNEYKSFKPTLIDQQWGLTDPKTQILLDRASYLLGQLDAYSQIVPDVDYFIQMHITKEATTSSRIEGTRTNMEEALIDKEDVAPENRDDWQEVQNYIEAIHASIKKQHQLPLSSRLLKYTHKILLQGVRGKDKLPGEFRRSQNWIGPSLKGATFIPPHESRVSDLMSDLEKFIHSDKSNIPHLIKIGIAHYQFETIHPFLDGNGRLGRLMITLYLVNFNLLSKPSLYLSEFFERNRMAYYNHLTVVRESGNMLEWLQFFLIGVAETALRSIQVFKDIIALKEKIELEKLPAIHTRKQLNARKLMHNLYCRPIVSVNMVSRFLKVQHNTATALINDFEELGILIEITGYSRNKVYAFVSYIGLFNQPIE